MQDLIIELNALRKALNQAIDEFKKRGRDKAKAEHDYRIALAQEILILRDEEKKGVTLIPDLARGKREIAKLKFNRDFAETLYESCQQYIYLKKKELDIVERQIQAERKGE